jgi:phosphoenolpyruvate carboxylase
LGGAQLSPITYTARFMSTTSAHTPSSDAKHQPLRDDVRRLGGLLGRLLQRQGPGWLYTTVEDARQAAIARRDGDAGGEVRLAAAVSGLGPAKATEVTRAFSAWFQLVNLAERMHRLRRLATYGEDTPGGLKDVLTRLRGEGVSAQELERELRSVAIEPVLTAHPTESVRRTMLVKELRMAAALIGRREDVAEPQGEHDAALDRVTEELTVAWQTEEHRADKPSVADEREHALFFLTTSIWNAVPAHRRAFAAALEATYGEDSVYLAKLPRLRFASWIGGDMDGNPAVGADTIRASLERHAGLARDLYRRELRELFRHLSQSRTRVDVSEAVDSRLEEYRALMPQAAQAIPARYDGMSYRELLWLMSARLDGKGAGAPHGYSESEELVQELESIAGSLRSNRGERAGLRAVEDLAERVRVFGFHLVTLDVRQDALVHRRAAGALLADPNFATRPAPERAPRLTRVLEAGVAVATSAPDAETARSLEVMRVIGDMRRKHGPEAVGMYIISMAQGADDALAVLLIARAAGLVSGSVPLDVAPLFETVDDLETAPATLVKLLADGAYRAHLKARGGVQWVMLGYSDSSKTSGLIASRVALQHAQTELLHVAGDAGVTLRFFHGRGGTASRGGTKPRQAILAAPRGALGGHLRVTEQGEIIQAKFGLDGIAERTLDLLLGATIERTLLDRVRAGDPGGQLLNELAHDGRAAYRALLEETPAFIPYFRAATPIDVIERLGLGSRPSSRREMRGVEDLRAIPWVFAWTQTRLLLPGWYGTGTSLDAAVSAHGLPALRDLAGKSAFFRTMLTDVEMVLAKAELGIARRYAGLAGAAGDRMFQHLAAEFARTRQHVLDLLEVNELLDREPLLQRAIQLRNPYIDPMSFLQVDLLARWREGGREDDSLLHALFATVHGLARGMQNTG